MDRTRIEQLRASFEARGVAGIVLRHPANVRYVTGLPASPWPVFAGARAQPSRWWGLETPAQYLRMLGSRFACSAIRCRVQPSTWWLTCTP